MMMFNLSVGCLPVHNQVDAERRIESKQNQGPLFYCHTVGKWWGPSVPCRDRQAPVGSQSLQQYIYVMFFHLSFWKLQVGFFLEHRCMFSPDSPLKGMARLAVEYIVSCTYVGLALLLLQRFTSRSPKHIMMCYINVLPPALEPSLGNTYIRFQQWLKVSEPVRYEWELTVQLIR